MLSGFGGSGSFFFARRVGDGVGSDAVRFPRERRFLAALLRDDRHPVGDHERSVEPYAELADQFRQVGAVLGGGGLHELLRAGGSDGAEVVFEILGVHAVAVIRNGEGLLLPVGGNLDLPVRGIGEDLLVHQTQIFGAVDGVGRVGEKLAKEYLFLRIE